MAGGAGGEPMTGADTTHIAAEPVSVKGGGPGARHAPLGVGNPMTATNTTIIAAMPIAMNVGSPASSMPAMAMSTVTPEMSTACPDVDAAMSRAIRRLAADVRFASRSVPLAEAMTATSPAFLA